MEPTNPHRPMSHRRPASGHPAERPLIRVAILLALAAAALITGSSLFRPAQTWYRLRQLADDDPAVRLGAANVLAAMAVNDPAVVAPLVAFLRDAIESENVAQRETAIRIGAWLIRRAEAADDAFAGGLDQAADETFLRLAGLLERGGRWRTPPRRLGQLVRREVIRLRGDGGAKQFVAVARLADLGPQACRRASDELHAAMESSDAMLAETALDALVTAGGTTRSEAIARATKAGDASLRQRAAQWIGVLQLGDEALRIAELLNDADAGVRESAAWSAGRLANSGMENRLVERITGDSAEMAAWALGKLPDLGDPAVDALIATAASDDPIRSSRALIAMGRQRITLERGSMFTPLLDHPSPPRRRAAAYMLSRCADGSDDRDSVVEAVRAFLVSALRAGRVTDAVAGIAAIVELRDRQYAGVLEDLVGTYEESAMVRLAAAEGLAVFDAAAGGDGLTSLLSVSDDVVRDLAAISLGRLPATSDFDTLTVGLSMDPPEFRAGCALALGCRYAFHGGGDAAGLIERLRLLDDRLSSKWEPVELVRGYALCARTLLGDESAVDGLDPFLLNDHFPRVAIWATLILSGDHHAISRLLLDEGPFDVDTFLHDARFMCVFAAVWPNAPRFMIHEDEAIRRFQVDRLRDWWRVRRWNFAPSPSGRGPG